MAPRRNTKGKQKAKPVEGADDVDSDEGNGGMAVRNTYIDSRTFVSDIGTDGGNSGG
jgi:hypothetical protein